MSLLLMQTTWTPTRAAALQRLEDFKLLMGANYTKERNYDRGRGNHEDVSCLSPYVSRRVLGEWELYNMARSNHSRSKSEKFCQEIIWRTYWKGWLEQREDVWLDYRKWLKEHGATKSAALLAAEQWTTGLDCFDAWAKELVDTGFLHNHARMWFASIWIFHFELPWQSGADFFFRHLLDGDAASNTLSWRWVAGLQTKGKNYVATPQNIAKYTESRFTPEDLNTQKDPLEEETAYSATELTLASVPKDCEPDKKYALLLHDENLLGDPAELLNLNISALCWLAPESSDYTRSSKVLNFQTEALTDAKTRLAKKFAIDKESIFDIESNQTVSEIKSGELQLLYFKPHVGPWREPLNRIINHCKEHQVQCTALTHQWDLSLFPFSTKGFFPFKKKALKLIEESPEQAGIRGIENWR